MYFPRVQDIQERLHQKIASATNDPGSDEARGPPAKIAKVEGGECVRVHLAKSAVFKSGCGHTDGEAEVKLERALKEIEQLKVDKEVAVDKRDKQVCTPIAQCSCFFLSCLLYIYKREEGLGTRLTFLA